ncbi:MAG: hypothetical protein M5U13_15755 [Thermoanaerobaculia bacterium]|nr:hypothetical protein [Thermoanaerobaculia bacterium]
MGSKKHWVDRDHYRTVSDDGRRSVLHKANHGILGIDYPEEVAIHHEDGTTTAYEYDYSLFGFFFGDGRGRRK